MGKIIASSLLAASLLSGVAAAESSKEEVHVKVNGVEITDSYKSAGISWTNVSQFSKLTNVNYEIDGDTATVNGTVVNAVYKDGTAYAKVKDLAHAAQVNNLKWTQEKNEAYALKLPTGVIGTPVVPAMGEHWMNPNKPEGPIYGVNNGELIFLEYMIPMDVFNKGENRQYEGMQGLAMPAVQHTDVDIQPHGHPGMEVPHYDFHMYFVTHDEHMAIKPAMPADHDMSQMAPSIEASVTLNGTTAVVKYEVKNLKVSAEHYGLDPVDGEGHSHVYLDGVKVTGLKEQSGTYEVKDLKPGKHVISVDLQQNNHKPIEGTTKEFTVEVK